MPTLLLVRANTVGDRERERDRETEIEKERGTYALLQQSLPTISTVSVSPCLDWTIRKLQEKLLWNPEACQDLYTSSKADSRTETTYKSPTMRPWSSQTAQSQRGGPRVRVKGRD